jgi:hypothetical protein
MFRSATFASLLLLLASVDTHWVYVLRPKPVQPFSALLPLDAAPMDIFLAVAEQGTQKTGELQPQARLELVRYVDGEYARVVLPIPSEKHGFRYKAGQVVNQKELHQALMRGSAANPGDQIQITDLEFHPKEIIVSINGGTKTHFNWRQHLQISVGPLPTAQTVSEQQGPAKTGAELILDYGGPVPDLSPDQLKRDLSPFLDFSGEHSAVVDWVDTLPPQFKQAIKDHKAIEGMNHDMVMAAMGAPDQKFREKDPKGNETEDWIYGHPPAKTVSVTFLGDKVIRVKEYN